MSDRETASLSLSDNPLIPIPHTVAVPVGCAIGELLPAAWHKRRVVCKYNGRYILRRGWACKVQVGDVVEFHELVEGKSFLRTVLSVALIVGSMMLPGALGIAAGTWQAAAVTAAASVIGGMVLNALIPIEPPRVDNGQSVASVYNVNISSNQARVDQAIPVIYGRVPVKPDYAGEPYYVFDENGDQIGHFLFCIGHGRYLIEQELIGRTSLASFQDVDIARLLQPGQQPGEVLATVVTSREVVSLDLPSGRIVGGFTACRPGRKVHRVGLDFVCPRGQAFYIDVRIDWREVDEQGAGISPWVTLANERINGNMSKPTRTSRLYDLPRVARVEIRCARTSLHSDDPSQPNEIEWAGLRGYLTDAAPLCATASHYELKIRASEQLSSLSANQFTLVVQRLLRVWQGEGWSTPLVTRNPFDAMIDALTNPDYVSFPLDLSRVDLATLKAYAVQADVRQDRFDYIFDSRISGWEALSIMARTGRATPFRRNSVVTAARDEPQAITTTAYLGRSILPGSFSATYAMPRTETADGVIAEYFDYLAFDWLEIECPAPGVSVTDPADPSFDAELPPMSRPERKRYRGISGPKHCEREGLYDAAWPIYRRKTLGWQTELQGILPTFGSEVLVAPAMARYAQSGDVAFWDEDTRVMGLSEPTEFVPGATHHLRLQRDDGSLTPPIVVTPGEGLYDVVLAEVPDFPLVLDDGTRERPRWAFGPATDVRHYARVTEIAHQGTAEDGSPMYQLGGVVDDPRVHTVDQHLLPGPGEIQDVLVPGEGGDDGGGGPGDMLLIIEVRNPVSVEADVLTSFTGPVELDYRFNADGTLSYRSSELGPTWFADGKWLRFIPIEASDAARFQIRATLVGQQNVDITKDTLPINLNTWLGMGVARTWTYRRGGPSLYGQIVTLRIEIRDAVTLVVQATTYLKLVVNNVDPGG